MRETRAVDMAKQQISIEGPKRNKRRSGFVSRGMLFTWFMLGGLIFFFAPQNLTNRFQFAFANIFRWPLGVGRTITLSARAQPRFIDVISRRKYDQLQNHLANITEELNQERQKLEELSRLRNRYPLEGAGLVLADVITASAEGFIINRGENDGLRKGQFVLGDNSIIGTISDVSPRTARVELITEITSDLAIEISGLKTVIRGYGENSAKVRLVSTKHKIRIGDNVYACKKPGFLDTPIIVGTVSKCRKNDENPLLWDITVKPACDVERLDNVTVIVMNP
jgi:rod shape-determining protein MreC